MQRTKRTSLKVGVEDNACNLVGEAAGDRKAFFSLPLAEMKQEKDLPNVQPTGKEVGAGRGLPAVCCFLHSQGIYRCNLPAMQVEAFLSQVVNNTSIAEMNIKVVRSR
jgi:hypothetical protein